MRGKRCPRGDGPNSSERFGSGVTTVSVEGAFSLVICTADRLKEVKRALASVAQQTLQPAEVVIVDGGGSLYRSSLEASDVRVIHSAVKLIHSARGLTLQRNVGWQSCSHEVIVFMDDDAVLTPSCLEYLVGAFERDESGRLGGATGRMVHAQASGWNAIGSWLGPRLFGLGEVDGVGRFKLSGFPSLPSGEHDMETDTLVGGLMAFRRKALEEVGGFDEALEGYGYMEEQDLAVRLRSAGWQLQYVANATFCHLPPARSGALSSKRAEMKVLYSRYVLEKNFRPRIANRIAWWWAVVGLMLAEARASGVQGAFGTVRGVRRVLRGEHRCLARGLYTQPERGT